MDFNRQLGGVIGVILVAIGVLFLGLAVYFARGAATVGGIVWVIVALAVIGGLSLAWGADMVWRARTGAVRAEAFFAGPLGAARAVIGLVVCSALAVIAVLLIINDLQRPTADLHMRLSILGLLGLAGPTALACLRALRRR